MVEGCSEEADVFTEVPEQKLPVAGSGRAVRKVYILERRQLDFVLGRWRQVVRILVGVSHSTGEEAAKEKREQRLGDED